MAANIEPPLSDEQGSWVQVVGYVETDNGDLGPVSIHLAFRPGWAKVCVSRPNREPHLVLWPTANERPFVEALIAAVGDLARDEAE
jgi:hypothetical protein